MKYKFMVTQVETYSQEMTVTTADSEEEARLLLNESLEEEALFMKKDTYDGMETTVKLIDDGID